MKEIFASVPLPVAVKPKDGWIQVTRSRQQGSILGEQQATSTERRDIRVVYVRCTFHVPVHFGYAQQLA